MVDARAIVARASAPTTGGKAHGRVAIHFSVLLAIGLGLGGCGLDLPYAESLMRDDDVTGAVVKAEPVDLPASLDPVDRKEADRALEGALDPMNTGSPVRWSNTVTGRKGSFTAKGDAFVRDDQLCRIFTATVEQGRAQSRYQGAACRIGGGSWTVDSVKYARREA
jgi:surface antigen